MTWACRSGAEALRLMVTCRRDLDGTCSKSRCVSSQSSGDGRRGRAQVIGTRRIGGQDVFHITCTDSAPDRGRILVR